MNLSVRYNESKIWILITIFAVSAFIILILINLFIGITAIIGTIIFIILWSIFRSQKIHGNRMIVLNELQADLILQQELQLFMHILEKIFSNLLGLFDLIECDLNSFLNIKNEKKYFLMRLFEFVFLALVCISIVLTIINVSFFILYLIFIISLYFIKFQIGIYTKDGKLGYYFNKRFFKNYLFRIDLIIKNSIIFKNVINNEYLKNQYFKLKEKNETFNSLINPLNLTIERYHVFELIILIITIIFSIFQVQFEILSLSIDSTTIFRIIITFILFLNTFALFYFFPLILIRKHSMEKKTYKILSDLLKNLGDKQKQITYIKYFNVKI